MGISWFYDSIKGDYDGTLSRLMNEARIIKYLGKFLENNDYRNFKDSLAAGSYEDAFRYAHNIKGMCLNLGLTPLANASADVCEHLRSGELKGDITEDAAKFEEVYNEIMAALKKELA